MKALKWRVRLGAPARIYSWRVSATLCLLAVVATGAASQGPSPDQLAGGKLLVATPKLRDPNFGETVVLLLEYSEEGALGVILNRPTAVSLPTAFPEIAGLEASEDFVFFGGPVAVTGMLMVLRSAQEVEEDRPAFDELYWSGSQDRLEQLAGEGATATFRVFAGHSGWGARQLDNEVKRGDWQVIPATAEVVFDPAPYELWPKLRSRIPDRWARVAN